jgi:alanine dehydrogenase
MIIGIPKEIKNNEYRVAASPGNVSDLVNHGHRVLVETGAGEGSGFYDEEYRAAGAEIGSTDWVYSEAELIYKVKEILPPEYKYMREGLIVVTYQFCISGSAWESPAAFRPSSYCRQPVQGPF